jgi:branched-chain amino acid aminotransferase
MMHRIAVWCLNNLDLNFDLIPFTLPEIVVSLDQVSALLPAGAYTTFRTYPGLKVLRLKDHFQRLESTARLANKPLVLKEPILRMALHQAIMTYCETYETTSGERGLNFRLRLTVDLEIYPGRLFIAVETLPELSPDCYLLGVKTITTRLERLLPEAKLTRFIERSGPVRNTLPEGVNEALMVNSADEVTEGLSSNFFGVIEGTVSTAGQDVLRGITRAITMECIESLNLPINTNPVRLDEIGRLDEAFITSSSRGVLPVTQIDQHVIGSGLPGGVTKQLMREYSDRVNKELNPIVE